MLRTIDSPFGEEPKDLCSRGHDQACEQRGPDSLRHKIEQMLIQHGARDFEMSADDAGLSPVELLG